MSPDCAVEVVNMSATFGRISGDRHGFVLKFEFMWKTWFSVGRDKTLPQESGCKLNLPNYSKRFVNRGKYNTGCLHGVSLEEFSIYNSIYRLFFCLVKMAIM